MDAHSVLLAEYVRKAIISQRDMISKTDPNYSNIKQAINILWKKYFIFAFNGDELISSVVQRLRTDFNSLDSSISSNSSEESKYIRAYIDIFGKKSIML